MWHNHVVGEIREPKFQLTHPSRGVARRDTRPAVCCRISTHTPLARCGKVPNTLKAAIAHFNSHTPREVWRGSNTNTESEFKFQLTHPSRGVAAGASVLAYAIGISTHTPLARCGKTRMKIFLVQRHFNSHTPREVWLGCR